MRKRRWLAGAVVAGLAVSTWPQPSNATLEDAKAAIDASQYHQAHEKLVPLAETGNARAQRMLGGLYLLGLGTPKNPRQAKEWFEKAAQNGDRSAMYLLGQSHKFGLGVDQDEGRAFDWYLKAAEKNHVKAQHEVGLRYSAGIGTKKNLERAVHWYRKAADTDHILSLLALAEMHRFGNTQIPRDMRKAISLYERAGKTGRDGSARALQLLGSIYSSEEEGRYDLVSAYAFYVLSIQQLTARKEQLQKQREKYRARGLSTAQFEHRLRLNRETTDRLGSAVDSLTRRLSPKQRKQGNHQVEVWFESSGR